MTNIQTNTLHLEARIPSFSYGARQVLEAIHLDFGPGLLVALLGPNGSGKSTLLKLLGGLVAPGGAVIRIGEREVARMRPSEIARWISWVPQRAETPFAVSVREMIRVGRTRVARPLRSLPRQEEQRVDRALAEVGLEAMADRPVDTLSGGEWQRALIARAVVQDTPILLLDEPVASLDLRFQDGTYRLLRRLACDGRLVLVADHHIETAAAFADRIVLLDRGRLAAEGPAAEVLDAGRIERVFGVRTEIFSDPVSGTLRLSRPGRDG